MQEKTLARARSLHQRLTEDYSSTGVDDQDRIYKSLERVMADLDDAIVKTESALKSGIPESTKNYAGALKSLRLAKSEMQTAMKNMVPDVGTWGPWRDTTV